MFVLTSWTVTPGPTGLRIVAESDQPATLWLLAANRPPAQERRFRVRRGQLTECGVDWHWPPVTPYPQNEPPGSIPHTWDIPYPGAELPRVQGLYFQCVQDTLGPFETKVLTFRAFTGSLGWNVTTPTDIMALPFSGLYWPQIRLFFQQTNTTTLRASLIGGGSSGGPTQDLHVAVSEGPSFTPKVSSTPPIFIPNAVPGQFPFALQRTDVGGGGSIWIQDFVGAPLWTFGQYKLQLENLSNTFCFLNPFNTLGDCLWH